MTNPHKDLRGRYRNWIRGGLGCMYLKKGLEPFCDEIVKKQHEEILMSIKQRKNLQTFSCGYCNIDTLRPDHAKNEFKHCPLGQIQCNCQSPRRKIACRNNVCGAIYDEIISLHYSDPPSPNWNNTNVRDWCTNPWEVAKCFISEDGYTQTKTAFDTDCSGLLSLLLNNITFRSHVSQTESFTQVQWARNDLFHSALHKRDNYDANKHLDAMITVLQDVPELKTQKKAKWALRRIKDLRTGRYCVTLQDETNVLEEICESVKKELFHRVGDAIQAQLKAMDKLKAFKSNERELTRATQNLKAIWNKAEISKRQTPSLAMSKDKTHSASRPQSGQLRQTEALADLNTLATSQSDILNKYYEVVEKGRMTIQELVKSTNQTATIHEFERLYQSCMETPQILKQTGGNKRDQYVQDWSASINTMSKLDYYCKYKKSFKFESYLEKIQNDNLRKWMTCLRLCSHKLEIELGRFVGTERNDRLCKMCSKNVIESEYHFLLCCEKYRTIRQKYLGNISWPTIDFITRDRTLSSVGISSTSKANVTIKLLDVKASFFPRYEYALENVVDILRRYKTVFSLSENGKPVSRDIAFHFCKDNSENDFPCDITDIVPQYNGTENFDERGCSWLTDSLTKKETSGCSVFVVSGNINMEYFECHKSALILIFCRSEREVRAVSKRQGIHSRENVLIVRKENAREQVETYLEKDIFRALSPLCEALFRNTVYARCDRRQKNTRDISTIAKETSSDINKHVSRQSKRETPQRPDSNKRKTMCSKFEIIGTEKKKSNGYKKSSETTLNENNQHIPQHGGRYTTKNAVFNIKIADNSDKTDSANMPFSTRNIDAKAITSPKDEKKKQLSYILKLDETILHTISEETKECLLDELIGLYNMSDVSEDEMPNIPEQRDQVEFDKLCKKLFARFPTIVGLGYRMRKLQLTVKDIQDFDTSEKRKDIHEALNQYNVHEYEIVPMSMKRYLTPGDEIVVGDNRASFGCFAKMEDKKDTDGIFCGLLSKHVATLHVATSHEMLAKTDGQLRRVGHILPETVTDGGLDIAAARLSVPVGACETRFKSARGRLKETDRGKLTSTARLSGTKVHMWGAVSKPGKGIITIPHYKCKGMDHYLIQVEDIVDGANEVEERFAQPGDSGAVTCADDPGQRYVHPVSMNMGCMNYKEVDEDNGKEVKTTRGRYLTVPLQSGLDQLTQRAGKGFDLY